MSRRCASRASGGEWTRGLSRRWAPLAGLVGLLLAACTSAAPTVPPTTAAPKPTAAPPAVSAAAPTTAPVVATSPVGVAVASPASSPSASAAGFNEQAVADFYRGKTVRLVVATGPGGTYDTYSRFAATYLPRYLPGNPTFIVENRPGGGGLVAANSVYNTEPKDGTVLLSVTEDLGFQQLIGTEGIQFDAGKYQWLGASVNGSYVCGARTDSGVNSFQDLLDGKPLIIGSVSSTSVVTHGPAVVVNSTLGTKMQVVPGYVDFNRIKLAVENGEIQGACGGWDGLVLVFGDLMDGDKPKFRILFTLGDLPAEAQTVPYFKNLPKAETFAKTEDARQLIRAVNSPARIAKPFAVVPEVPADRVAALRQALAASYADPAFLAQARQAKLFVTFSSGETVQQVVRDLLASPPSVRDKLREILH